MKHIVIIPNATKDAGLEITQRIINKLVSLGAEVYIDKRYSILSAVAVHTYDTLPLCAELIIVVGGDGSILDASAVAIEMNIPILGVNLGKVGYLSEVEPDHIEILSNLFCEKYTVTEKMLLTATHISGENVYKSDRYAVNDIIISHDGFLGIADFVLENSVGDSVKYRADGIIFSTPVGSTAYSLSAGGPIVSHDIDSIVATPICPHSFFNRSIIFKHTEHIKLTNVGNAALNISIDGRYFGNFQKDDKCIIATAAKKLKLLTFNNNNMFSTLFNKVRILEDIK